MSIRDFVSWETAITASFLKEGFMQHILSYVEQLDLAAQQLKHVDDPAYGRFALILTDNLIELMLHKRCKDEMWMENLWVKIGKPKYTKKEREDVLGRYFAPKVKFVR